jgi:hypothetical protein
MINWTCDQYEFGYINYWTPNQDCKTEKEKELENEVYRFGEWQYVEHRYGL